ncbi:MULTISPECIES: UDP-glucose/GDP-mannose dehydrogenase family protein [unclassified Streptomyces]|uniref:UDP-glucose dehydrogenase family protein n=1 Tax=unclassified Streptomyces TaxID=2593676 RepID=UPI0023655327|nr:MULTISPECIES: UDP-glucose/GDP-mannose dehydrogenase family protein [unclassified Streptomyces]MDF3140757.1 UDP-glucose/GDP-mannose dehydrogenase family protein [Streptomyces sp. T21Q-yed]WDF40580.1 UDP-glucose/GDP-mannose dehydrogenase family protein [Streptomyces sp. T12]
MRLTVIGTGYLGATHAACMAELGHEVLGVDVDPEKVAALQAGRVPFHEPGLPELIAKHTASGRLRFTSDYAEAGAFGDVHFVCVGTPQLKGSEGAELTYVDSAFAAIAAHAAPHALLVGKSTVPVGTAGRLADAHDGVEVAWNPEFLREGFAVEDTLRPDRLVFGVRSERAETILREVYAPVLTAGTPLVTADFPTAELVKTAANAFLATKISFINAMAELCETAGGDVGVLAEAIGYDDRIGRKFLRAGVGFGGGCLPKDIRAFAHRADELGVSLAFLREVDAINMRRRDKVVELARELCGGAVLGARIAVLGAAFKPDSDDIRDSPALNVAARLRLDGGDVTVYDPEAMDNARKAFPLLGYALSAEEALQRADLVLHLTEWPQFREIDPVRARSLVSRPRIVDGRGVLDADRWTAAGWRFRALGRSAPVGEGPR